MVITLEARERGLLTRGASWQGKIVSVYARAVNIRRPDGLLVSLVEERTQMSALSVHVPDLFGPAKTQLHAVMAPGAKACGDELRIAAGGRQVILEGAPWYDSALRLDPRSGFPEPKREFLRRALLARGRDGGLLGVIAPAGADNAFARFAAALLRDAAGDRPLLTGLKRLVGLGIGFTPSGDDFLAGVLLGEALAGRETRLRLDREEIRGALAKTSDGGRSLLHQVLAGHFPHYLLETAAALAAARDEAAVDGAVAGAVRHGETSGTDTLAGLLWYLTAAADNPADMA